MTDVSLIVYVKIEVQYIRYANLSYLEMSNLNEYTIDISKYDLSHINPAKTRGDVTICDQKQGLIIIIKYQFTTKSWIIKHIKKQQELSLAEPTAEYSTSYTSFQN